MSALILLFHYAAILASLSSLSSSGESEEQNVWTILNRALQRFCSLPASVSKLAKKYVIIANITNVFRNLVFNALLLTADSDTIQIHFTIISSSTSVSPNTLEYPSKIVCVVSVQFHSHNWPRPSVIEFIILLMSGHRLRAL